MKNKKNKKDVVGSSESTYVVEITFETVVVLNRGTAEETQVLELRTEVASFKDYNKSVAKQRAQDFFNLVLRTGLKKSGGSVVLAVVPANAIKNIALVDFSKFQQEQEEAQAMYEAAEAAKTSEETPPTAPEE